MSNSTLETLCPMCGARLGFSRLKCVACGELLVEAENSPATYDEFLVIRARSSARITGFFITFVAAIITVVGVAATWDVLSKSDTDAVPFAAGALIVGLCWLIGGVMIFRLRAVGYWFVQPIFIALLVAQLVRLDDFNVFLFALIAVFAILCHHTRKLIREAEASKKSV